MAEQAIIIELESGEITEMNEISHRKGEHSSDTIIGALIEYSVSTETLRTLKLILVAKKIEKEKKEDIEYGSDQPDDTIILSRLSAIEDEGPCQSADTVILSATEEGDMSFKANTTFKWPGL
ncbi:Hypothetical predicted protein [Paramuricea clavata]|uniref:Uncharacterized protein n=1 Tax=Paramuricea clavata TaxID=317549 RepID=A0A6S7FUA7_PARCT|nr:Hypothetical predicted protein [Paramuricea clavata]